MDPRAVSEIDGVNLVVGNDDKDEILKQVAAPVCRAAAPRRRTRRLDPPLRAARLGDADAGLERPAELSSKCRTAATATHLLIVPAARGPQRSRSIQTIVDEINLLYRLGYREAVLTGVQIGAYGSDWDRETRRIRKGIDPTLTGLVERVSTDTPIPRIRSPRSSRRIGRTDSWTSGKTRGCAVTCTCRCRAAQTRSLSGWCVDTAQPTFAPWWIGCGRHARRGDHR